MENLDLLELQYLTATISDSIQDMHLLVDRLLSHPEKGYAITFKNKKFEFFTPTTKSEFIKLKRDRLTLFKLITKNCLDKVFRSVPLSKDLSEGELEQYERFWDDIFMLARGVNPADFKCERITYENTYAVGDSINGKSRPLDLESYHINNERPEVKNV